MSDRYARVDPPTEDCCYYVQTQHTFDRHHGPFSLQEARQFQDFLRRTMITLHKEKPQAEEPDA